MISVIVPVYNEEKAISNFLQQLSVALSGLGHYEIIIVDDGSKDSSLKEIKGVQISGLRIIEHDENLGYGKSLYDGIVAAKYDCIAIIDGDCSYPPGEIKNMLKYYPEYDMIVGAREGREYKSGIFKHPARIFFKRLAEYAAGRKMQDVNSGLRIFKRDVVLKYRDSLCTGFSFTTTLTLIFILNHYSIKYVPIGYCKRLGKSKVRHFKDTLRAGQIIIEAILYYNPTKLFLLLASCNAICGILMGALNYFYFRSFILSIVAGISIASFIPVFAIGLLCAQLKRIYALGKIQ